MVNSNHQPFQTVSKHLMTKYLLDTNIRVVLLMGFFPMEASSPCLVLYHIEIGDKLKEFFFFCYRYFGLAPNVHHKSVQSSSL